jgi:DNA-binding PadR family transcriptional regulator
MSPKEQPAVRILMDNRSGLFGSQLVSLSEGKLVRGTVYVLLERLVDQGLVREEEVPPTSEYQLARTRHFITGLGRKAYNQMLADQKLQMIRGAFAR